jgi:hypothetical protein
VVATPWRVPARRGVVHRTPTRDKNYPEKDSLVASTLPDGASGHKEKAMPLPLPLPSRAASRAPPRLAPVSFLPDTDCLPAAVRSPCDADTPKKRAFSSVTPRRLTM